MANMSYVRFENTLIDLRNCYENMDNEEISDSEMRAKKRLIQLCEDIALDYSYLLENEEGG